MALHHFLLVYDLTAQALIKQLQIDDGDEAAAKYAQLEREFRDRRDLEIVLVGADSLDTIKRTHAHYFDGTPNASPYLAGV